jgi:hypothetical protein
MRWMTNVVSVKSSIDGATTFADLPSWSWSKALPIPLSIDRVSVLTPGERGDGWVDASNAKIVIEPRSTTRRPRSIISRCDRSTSAFQTLGGRGLLSELPDIPSSERLC